MLLALGCGVIGADRILDMAEKNLYADEWCWRERRRYQRIVLTRGRTTCGCSSTAPPVLLERRVPVPRGARAPGLSRAADARRVLVLGGGDGLAVREILKHPGVEHVTLVDLDPEMTGCSRRIRC